MDSCRLCFSTGHFFNIFSDHETIGLDMVQIISDHFKCEVSELDYLPKYVCGKCWELTETFHNFYISVKLAQMEFLAKSIKTEEVDQDMEEPLSQRNYPKTNFVECKTILSEEMKTEETNAEAANDVSLNDDKDISTRVKLRRINKLKSQKALLESGEDNKNLDHAVEPIAIKPKKYRRTKEEKEIRNAAFERLMSENKHRFDLKCDTCTYQFESLEDARQHYLKAHNNAKGYIKCCRAKLRQRCDIVEHINYHLYPEKHKCNMCNKVYSRKDILDAHVRKHTAPPQPKIKQQFACELCDKILTTESGLKRHISGHENTAEIKIYKEFMDENFDMNCDLCENSKFESFFEARTHYKDIHDIPKGYVKCCKAKLTEIWAVHDHIDFHLNPESYKCNLCDKIFAGKIALKLHAKRHTDKESRQFMCDICGKYFPQRKIIREHILTVHVQTELKFECDSCQKWFPSKKRLSCHKILVHPSVQKICEFCGKSFKTNKKLQVHLQTHDADKDLRVGVQCEYCGDWVRTSSGIYYHKQLHTSGRQQCTQCDMVLPHRLSLQEHVRNHHQERKHKCNYCGKLYVSPYKLKEHLDSHMGQASYSCQYCPMVFKARSSLQTHRSRLHYSEWKRDQARKNFVMRPG